MATKSKLGSDPLAWIGGSRGGGKSIKQSKHKLQIKKKQGRPKTSKREITSTTQEGLPEGWNRATFIVREGHLEKLKALAYWDRKQIKEVIDEALGSYLKNKRIKSKPKK